MLEQIEQALDEIAFAIKREVARSRGLAVGLGRDDRGDLALREGVDERIGIISLVADQGLWVGVFDQRLGASQIVVLSGRQHQRDGIAQRIDERMDLRGQSAARAPDRLRTVFFRAPALC